MAAFIIKTEILIIEILRQTSQTIPSLKIIPLSRYDAGHPDVKVNKAVYTSDKLKFALDFEVK